MASLTCDHSDQNATIEARACNDRGDAASLPFKASRCNHREARGRDVASLPFKEAEAARCVRLGWSERFRADARRLRHSQQGGCGDRKLRSVLNPLLALQNKMASLVATCCSKFQSCPFRVLISRSSAGDVLESIVIFPDLL